MLDYRERARISAEEQLKRPPAPPKAKPWWQRISYPYVISTFAFLISATSFYFTNFDTRRDLLMFSKTIGDTTMSRSYFRSFEFYLIFKNAGEDVEIVEALSLQRIVVPVPGVEVRTSSQTLWQSSEPVILKGGEAKPVAIQHGPMSVPLPEQIVAPDCNSTEVLAIEMTIVARDGGLRHLDFPIADICGGTENVLDNPRGLDRAPVHLLADNTAALYPQLWGYPHFPGCDATTTALPICRKPPPAVQP